MDLSVLDFSLFTEIPAPCGLTNLSMTAQGVLTLSSTLRERLGETRTFKILISEDGRILCLQPDSKGKIHFSPKGRVTHKKMREMLASRGVGLPACYQLEWSDEYQTWVGCSEDLPTPPPVKELISPRGPGRRRKN